MRTWTLVMLGLVAATPLSAQSSPMPDTVSIVEFRNGLGWLEGRWVGSGGGYEAFYEAYRFVDGATLEQTTYPDSTFGQADGRATIEFRNGRIVKLRDGAQESRISRIAGDTIRFERVQPGRPGFTWIRRSDDEWTAILERPEGREPVVYTLRRLRGG